jgi:hypothetical protein
MVDSSVHAGFRRTVYDYCFEDYSFRRFLRANAWDLAAAQAQLHTHLAWRYETQPEKPCDIVRLLVISSII